MPLQECIIVKLNEWRMMSLSARDATTNPVRFVELTGQINTIDAVSILVQQLTAKDEMETEGGE
jgi:hypothetical protein